MSRGASLFFYRRMASPLHAARAGVGALWVLSLSAAALLLYHPLALVVLLAAVLGAAWATGVGHEMRRALLTASIIGVPIVLVNVLASRQGLTVFARLGDLGPFGQGDLTVEAVVYGAVVALKVTIVILVATLASLAIDPDELLRLVRRLSFRSALTASLAVRMVPLLAADAQRLGEAQRTARAAREAAPALASRCLPPCSEAPSIGPWTWRRRSRSAALPTHAVPGAFPGLGRDTTSPSPPRRWRCWP